MTDDQRACARLTVTLPTDLLTSLIRIAGRLRLPPSQIVECACRDLLTRQPRQPDDPPRKRSSYIEMTAREAAHDISMSPPPRSSAIDFRPVRPSPSDRAPAPSPAPGNAADRARAAAPQPSFSRIALAAEAFAQEQASKGSWLCDPVYDQPQPKPQRD